MVLKLEKTHGTLTLYETFHTVSKEYKKYNHKIFVVVMASKLEQTDFSPSCRCLTHVVKAPLKINYDYMEKVSAWIAEVKFQPGLGKLGSLLTGLKISHVIVFSLD